MRAIDLKHGMRCVIILGHVSAGGARKRWMRAFGGDTPLIYALWPEQIAANAAAIPVES